VLKSSLVQIHLQEFAGAKKVYEFVAGPDR